MDFTDIEALQALTEDDARDYLERLRWSKGVLRLIRCPACGSDRPIYRESREGRPGYFRCPNDHSQSDGNRQLSTGSKGHFVFTVRTSTTIERSHISLRGWLIALCVVSSGKTPYLPHVSGLALGRLISASPAPTRRLIARIRELDRVFFTDAHEDMQSHVDYFLMRHRARCLLRQTGQVIREPYSFKDRWNPDDPLCARHILLLENLSN